MFKVNKSHWIYAAFVVCIIMLSGVTISFAADAGVGCDGTNMSTEPNNGPDNNDAAIEELVTPNIGSTYYTNSDCFRIYGSAYKSCGGNCYHMGYASCANSSTGLICSGTMRGCPSINAKSCYRVGFCSCRNGKVVCN